MFLRNWAYLCLALSFVSLFARTETHGMRWLCSSEWRDLLRRLLEKDPSKRISLDEALQHPWVASDVAAREQRNIACAKQRKEHWQHQQAATSSSSSLSSSSVAGAGAGAGGAASGFSPPMLTAAGAGQSKKKKKQASDSESDD